MFIGYITQEIFIGTGTDFFLDNSLFIHPLHEIKLDTEFTIPILYKNLAFILAITFTIIFMLFSEYLPKIIFFFKFSKIGYYMNSFFNLRFLIEFFYNRYIVELTLKLGGQIVKTIDKGFVELVGPFGLEKLLIIFSKKIVKLDVSLITSYALYILIGLIFYLITPYTIIANNNFLIIIIYSLIYMV